MRCRIVTLSFLGFLLSGCGGNRLGEIEDAVTDLRTIQAQHTATLSALETDVRSLKGKVDELNYAVTGKAQELENKLKIFGSRMPPPEGVPAELLADDEERIARNSGPAAELYRKGLEQLRSGDIDTARTSFESFINENPDTSFTDNALFWVGVCLEKGGQYDRAIVSLSKVFQSFPAEDRAPVAMFRLAEVFLKIEAKEDAVLTYQKLIDDYPRSEFAGRAKDRVRELKGSGGRSRG